jgi:adenine-specific DNA-methyltransferase
VPHVTLKSIANNPDIDAIYEDAPEASMAAWPSLNAGLAEPTCKPVHRDRRRAQGQKLAFSRRRDAARMGSAI